MVLIYYISLGAIKFAGQECIAM